MKTTIKIDLDRNIRDEINVSYLIDILTYMWKKKITRKMCIALHFVFVSSSITNRWQWTELHINLLNWFARSWCVIGIVYDILRIHLIVPYGHFAKLLLFFIEKKRTHTQSFVWALSIDLLGKTTFKQPTNAYWTIVCISAGVTDCSLQRSDKTISDISVHSRKKQNDHR